MDDAERGLDDAERGLLAELNGLFVDARRVPDGTPATPSPWVVAPERIPPFSFLIQRCVAAPRTPRQSPARGDQLVVSLRPPPKAPPAERIGQAFAHPETYTHKAPPPLVVPNPKWPSERPPAWGRNTAPTLGKEKQASPPLQASTHEAGTTHPRGPKEPPASEAGGPPDIDSRMQAVRIQTMELWSLNQLWGTDFTYLATAIKHAEEKKLINEAERRRLWRVNDAGNHAKHKGLGSRSRSLTPAPRARTCSPRTGSRAVSSMDPAPLSPPAAPISAPLSPPWDARARSHSGWV